MPTTKRIIERINGEVTSARLGAIVAGTAVVTATASVALTVTFTGDRANGHTVGTFPAAVAHVAASSEHACATPSPRPTPHQSPGRRVRRIRGLTPGQRRKADELISTFENSTTSIRYDYAQNLGDGRGFTTADGDALEVVQRYTGKVPHNPLARFLHTLKRLADDGDDDTGALPEHDYIAAWKRAAKDPRFRKVQDEVSDRLYFDPAMDVADKIGLRTPLARAELYDAIVQHGGGDDPDSLSALVKRTDDAVHGTPAHGVDEHRWLAAFFRVRADDLTNPSNKSTKDEWSESVDRVRSMQRIAGSGNFDLHGTLHTTAYGDKFTIK